MLFKYYPIFVFILGILLGVYTYTITNESFTLTLPFSDTSYTMPIALWVTFMIYSVFLISMIFLFSERLSIFLDKNAVNNDKNIFINKIKNNVVGQESSNLVFKTRLFKELGSVIDSFDLKPKDNVLDCENVDIKKLLAMYENLKNGEEIDIYKFNIPPTSPLFTINTKNMITKSYKNGFSVLKNKAYIYELKKFAFIALLNNGDRKEIEKYKEYISFDKEIAIAYLDVFINKRINISNNEISTICKNAKFTKDDYILFAKQSKGKLEPNDWIKVFEYLADNDDLAEESYLYVLLELEMLDSVKDRLKSQPTYEFSNIRAYLDLKSYKKSYPMNMFFC